MQTIMKIPHEMISSDALIGLIEEIVTRDGTDYGAEESSTQEKINQVMKALKEKEAYIVFDEETESCNVLSAEEIKNIEV